jgi:hypothetical protein
MTRRRKLRNVRDRQWSAWLRYLNALRKRSNGMIPAPAAWARREHLFIRQVR